MSFIKFLENCPLLFCFVTVISEAWQHTLMQVCFTYIQRSCLLSCILLCCIDTMSTLLYAVVRGRGKQVLDTLKIPEGIGSEDDEDNVKRSGTPDSNADIDPSASTLLCIIVFFPNFV